VDSVQARAVLERGVRRGPGAAPPGAWLDDDGDVIRVTAADPDGWSGITWSGLAGPDATDAAIARQVRHFAALRYRFEWPVYDYDQPPDLGGRLAAAGFTAGPPETALLAEVAVVAAGPAVPLPAGLTLRTAATAADAAALATLHHRVFGADRDRTERARLAELRAGAGRIEMLLILDGDEVVCAARIDFPPGSEVAGLYGGGTLPGWRHRGLYRVLVGYRARRAAERGYRYLAVDATGYSEPVLRRLGFTAAARTTPYEWRPRRDALPRPVLD
jgi:hypothetical protein